MSLRPAAWPGDDAFFRTIGPEVLDLAPGRASLRLVCDAQFVNAGGAGLHGGAYGAFAICAAEVAAATGIAAGQKTVLVETKTHVLRRLAEGDVATLAARTVQGGRRYQTVLVEISNAEGKTCALTTATFAVTSAHASGPPPPEPAATPWPEVAVAPLPRPADVVPETDPWYADANSWRTLGVEVSGRAPGYGEAQAPFQDRFTTHDGSLHPAYVLAVMDSVTVPTCASSAAENETYTTLEYKANCWRPVTAGPITVTGRIVGRSAYAHSVWVDALDADGRRCASMLTSLAVLQR